MGVISITCGIGDVSNSYLLGFSNLGVANLLCVAHY